MVCRVRHLVKLCRGKFNIVLNYFYSQQLHSFNDTAEDIYQKSLAGFRMSTQQQNSQQNSTTNNTTNSTGNGSNSGGTTQSTNNSLGHQY